MNTSSKLKPNLFMIITLVLIGGGLLVVQFFSETGIIEKIRLVDYVCRLPTRHPGE